MNLVACRMSYRETLHATNVAHLIARCSTLQTTLQKTTLTPPPAPAPSGVGGLSFSIHFHVQGRACEGFSSYRKPRGFIDAFRYADTPGR